MKLKNMWKRFWTLDVHNHEGFTLVELIIVIAILAILSTGAIAGYSAYVENANVTTDEALAAEIKNVMILAYYNGTLQPGASVVVHFGDQDAQADPNGTDFGTAQVMADAYGANWQSALRLKWAGWKDEMNKYPSGDQMANVQNSNFNSDNMGTMLGQVQTVVNAAAGYFENRGTIDPDSAVAGYLDNAGIDYSTGINAGNSSAAANALVFVVAGNLSNVGTEGSEVTEAQFWLRWKTNGLRNIEGWDTATKEAASYAMVYAAATYVDNQTGTTTYRQEMEGEFDTIINNGRSVLDRIKNDHADVWATYYGNGDNASPMYKDAMAFLTYMQGVSTSADSLTSKTDLTNSNYFNDGTVLSYVNDYVSMGEAIQNLNVANGAFVFYLNANGTVSCLPLDY